MITSPIDHVESIEHQDLRMHDINIEEKAKRSHRL